MGLDNIKNSIYEKYEEGDNLRLKFNWIAQRFHLEFGEKFDEYYYDFLKDKVDETYELNDDIFSDKSVFEYINACKIDEDSINTYWKNKNVEFINLLSNYRKAGSIDNNVSEQLMNFAKNINNDPLRYIYEILQNADDCIYANALPEFNLDLTNIGKMIVSYNEIGMSYSDIISLTTVGQSNKKDRKKRRLIGEKGIGFKTIFSVCETVEIHSGGYHFKMTDNNFAPQIIDSDGTTEGTRLILFFKENVKSNDGEHYKNKLSNYDVFPDLKNKYGVQIKDNIFDKQSAFKNCPIMFTNRLKKIYIKGKNEESFSIERTAAYTINYEINNKHLDSIEYYCYEKNIKFTYDEYCSRYPNQFNETEYDALEDKTAITYPIVIIAPKNTKEITEGNIYSFLPTYTNIKAPFNIQMPAKLSLDRSCIWFNGNQDTMGEMSTFFDGETNLWNKRLLNECFWGNNSLIKNFYDDIKEIDNVFKYVPEFSSTDKNLFKSEDKYADGVKQLNKYCENFDLFDAFKEILYFKCYKANCYCNVSQAVMFDDFIMKNFNIKYFEQIDDGERKNRCLVDFNKLAIQKMQCFEFKQFEVSKKDKIHFLNSVLEQNESIVLSECQKEDKDRSVYIPDKIEDLKIYPSFNITVNKYRIIINTIKYESYANKFWFINRDDAPFLSSNNICFLAYNVDFESGLLKKIKNKPYEIHEVSDVWDKVWYEIHSVKGDDETYKCDYTLFKELLTFLATYTGYDNKNWFDYSKMILKEETDYKLWCEDDKKRTLQLIDLINANMQKYIKNIEEEVVKDE